MTERVQLTPYQYSVKTAYRIDPLLAKTVDVIEFSPCRINGELDAGSLWKRRHRNLLFRTPSFITAIAFLVIAFACAPMLRPDPVDAGSACPTVRVGDSGKAVTAIQYRLRSNGWSVEVDGQFGSQTLRAVTIFQRMNGLATDGVVGPVTQRMLGCGQQSAPPVQEQSTPTGLHAASYPTSSSKWIEVASSAGWPEHKLPFVACVIARESRGIPTAYNGRRRDRSYGLMQLNTKGRLWSWYTERGLTSKDQLFDPYINLRYGFLLWQEYPNAWGRCRSRG